MNQLKHWVSGLVLVYCLLTGVWTAAATSMVTDVWRSKYLVVADEDNRKWAPAVAYTSLHDEYLVVWETIEASGHHAIYGRRVNASGQLYDEFLIFSGTYNSLQPAVTYDTSRDLYLVVWAYDSAGDGTDGDIFGRLIPWYGPIDGETAFGIDTSRSNSDKPKLAYSPTSDEYLVIWRVLPEALDSNYYIAGGIIYSDKTGVPVGISSGPEARDFPDVTYNLVRNEFVVVWDEDLGQGAMDLDIRAIRLDFTGAPMTPGEFAVTTSISNEQHPTVAACYQADEYLFAWQQQINQGPDDNIYGRMMTGSGVLGQTYGIAGTTLPQRYPDLSCNPAGSEFIMVWHDQYAQPLWRWGVWGEVIQTNFHVQPAFEVVRPSDDRDRLYPAVAYGNKTALVVWQHARDYNNFLDIWGQLVRPHMNFMPLVGK